MGMRKKGENPGLTNTRADNVHQPDRADSKDVARAHSTWPLPVDLRGLALPSEFLFPKSLPRRHHAHAAKAEMPQSASRKIHRRSDPPPPPSAREVTHTSPHLPDPY